MKRISSVLIVITLVLAGSFTIPARAQEQFENDTRLTVPWDEFKRLVNLDEDDIVISLVSFQKLLAQTGIRSVPTHELQGGNVVMSREEFKKLVDQMKPPPGLDSPPPFAHLITKAMYSGQMKATSTDISAVFSVHVLKKNTYVTVPILPQHVALADMKVDGKPALVVVENGYHSIILPSAGEYEVEASYSVRTSLDKGPYKIDLSIQPTPITLLTLEMPVKDIDVEIPQAQQVLTGERGDNTVVSAVVGQGSTVSIRWRKKVAVADKLPAKLYSEVHHLISIEDDALKTNTTINYNILHSEVDAVRVVLPKNVNVLAISGEGVGEWQETEEEDRRILLIPFTYGKKGAAAVTITTETTYSETGLANVFRGIRTLDTVRETGFIGIELATSAEVVVTENDGLEKAVVQKLPVGLIHKSARPLIMGFKYLMHPFSLVFDIKKHEKIAVPVATINSANVVSLFTEDGKIVNRVVYQVRNGAKQFLEIHLPESADVWSVFVGDNPVESSVNGQGKLLVPLIRSRMVDNRLDTFPVEVIYCMVQDRFSPYGLQESTLPAVDLLISQLLWSVYLPNDYAYLYFESTLEKEEIIRGVNVLSSARRQYDADKMRNLRVGAELNQEEMRKAYKDDKYQSSFKNIPLEADQLASQMNAELEFGGRLEGLAENPPQTPISGGAQSTGVLPLQIKVPTSGQVYRFARTIIRPQDPLEFRVHYSRMWVLGAVKWIGFGFIGLIVYGNRKRLMKVARSIGRRVNVAARWVKTHEAAIKKQAQAPMTTFVLFGLFIALWRVSGSLALLCFILFCGSLAYQTMRLARKRAEMREAPKTPVGDQGRGRE